MENLPGGLAGSLEEANDCTEEMTGTQGDSTCDRLGVALLGTPVGIGESNCSVPDIISTPCLGY